MSLDGLAIAGAGAFGTALAISLAREGQRVRLWARDPAARAAMRLRRESARLPGIPFPEGIEIVETAAALAQAPEGGRAVVLLAMPMQALRGFLHAEGAALLGADLIACCKGIDLDTLQGPAEVIAAAGARGAVGVLTGPSFAADIARGLPTALTLACADPRAEALQHLLSTAGLRLYRSDDVVGAELGGALKNVIAIAAGIVIGAGLGDSARAALITRGYAEMERLAARLGARSETLSGLSGLGDLMLTCTSRQSRNFAHGLALGGGQPPPAGTTTEGLATARAALRLAQEHGIDLPITRMVALVVAADIDLSEAVTTLMSRPLKQE